MRNGAELPCHTPVARGRRKLNWRSASPNYRQDYRHPVPTRVTDRQTYHNANTTMDDTTAQKMPKYITPMHHETLHTSGCLDAMAVAAVYDFNRLDKRREPRPYVHVL